MDRLRGKVAIVTGAAGGMGEATARLFVQEGAGVLLTDVDSERGRSIAGELGGAADYSDLDVSDAEQWAAAVAFAEMRFGPVNVLVNNAGFFMPSPLQESDEADFDQHVNINQRGTFLGMRAVAEAMQRGGGGAIVNISSTAGLGGGPGMFNYRSSKWAVRGMTRAAAHDLAKANIRVNSIHPGPIDTRMMQIGSDPDRSVIIAGRTLMKRLGHPSEVAAATLFLVSDEASYITGIELPVDGGLTA